MTTPRQSLRHCAARTLTREEAAEHLQLSTKTISRKIAAGELIAMRMGRLIRISEDEVRAYKLRCQIVPFASTSSL